MDVVMSGVGGQGTVLASRIIGECAIQKGLEVRTSEIIGMAQREGSVISQVRMGQTLYGGLIPDQGADILLGFELAEAVRASGKLKKGGTAIVNIQTVIPPTVYLGMSKYDQENLIDSLKEYSFDSYLIDAADLARQAGNVKAVSAVMLGAFSNFTGDALDKEKLLEVLLTHLPDKLAEINKKAFYLGQQAVEVR